MNVEINNKQYDVKESIELNHRIEDMKIERNKEIEILSEICQEKDTTKYGKEVDKVVGHMNKIFDGVKKGNVAASVELNAVQTILIERDLVKRLDILSKIAFADKLPIMDEYNDTLKFKYNYRVGKASAVQAHHATFPFATYDSGEATIKIEQITAGAVGEYYRMNDSTITTFAEQSRNAVDEMYNIAESRLFRVGYQLMKDSDLEIKMWSTTSGGISKVDLDQFIRLLRRDGVNPTIYGTYPMVDQISAWEGWNDGAGNKIVSPAMIDEIRSRGVLGTYKGCTVVVINEGVDMSTIELVKNSSIPNAKWFGSVLPEGLMYVMANKVNNEKVLKFGFGKLKTMVDTDINTASIARRWDMPFGVAMIPTALPFIGFIEDDRFSIY